MELAGAKALVTGGAVRVGREIALELARGGASVIVHYRTSGDAAREAAAEIRALGVGCETLSADLADPAAVDEVVQVARDVDVLVNSASVFPRTPLAEADAAVFDDIMAVNLRAPFLLARGIGLAMRQRGRGVIVNIADWAARRPYPGYLPYCMSKAGLVAMSEGLARALAPEVRVNTVAPGPVLWPDGLPESTKRTVLEKTPLGRPGTPADVARAVRFLVEGSDFVTGAFLTVDGGRTIA